MLPTRRISLRTGSATRHSRGTFLSALIALLGAPVALLAQQPPPDLIFSNGKIITVDERFTIAQSVAIRAERIVAVGPMDAITIPEGAEVIDAAGMTVMPGLINSNQHIQLNPLFPSPPANLPLADFKAVLDRGQPFAFIGKACDISAIRNYAKFDPRVDQLLKYTANFFCGGVSEFGKTMDYVRKVGLLEEHISHLRYRGDGCPGPMVMKSHDGREFAFSYNEMWEDEARWQLMFRCKICPDSIGDLADITVADVWPGGKPITDGIGFNGFIARTRRGEELLNAMIRDNAITITEPLDYDGLELAQGSHMYKKQSITSRLTAMGDECLIVPEFEDLRLDQAAAMLTEAERQDNYDGMLSRLAAGDNVERLPVAPKH